jgi:hypothetical protein
MTITWKLQKKSTAEFIMNAAQRLQLPQRHIDTLLVRLPRLPFSLSFFSRLPISVPIHNFLPFPLVSLHSVLVPLVVAYSTASPPSPAT